LKASSLGLFYRRKQIDQATEIIWKVLNSE
jgi:hypothetical protein